MKTAMTFDPLPPVPRRRRKSSYTPDKAYVQAPTSRMLRGERGAASVVKEEREDQEEEGGEGGGGNGDDNSSSSGGGGESAAHDMATYARKSLNLDAIKGFDDATLDDTERDLDLALDELKEVNWSGTKLGHTSENDVHVTPKVIAKPKTYDSTQMQTGPRD